MKAILLAAGLGTRLSPMTDRVPKILIHLGGRPLLDHQLYYLESQGVSEVVVNVHHHADQVVAAAREYPGGLTVRISEEPELLGTAGALRPVARHLTEPFVVLYGDVVTDIDLGRLFTARQMNRALAVLAVYPSTQLQGKGVCEFGGDGRVLAFHEKTSTGQGHGFVSAGVYVLDPAIFDRIPAGFQDFGQHVWPSLLVQMCPIYAHVVDAYVRDIGSLSSLRAAERDIAEGRLRW